MSISPAAEAIEQVLARAPLLAPREQGNAQTGLLGERRNRFHVLAREHFRGRHERRLRAGFDRDRHGEQGDDRLAGADVALQQPQHAPRRRHIGLDLAHGLALRARQREGERVGDRRADASVAPDAPAGPALEAHAHEPERELARKQLVVGEPLPGQRAGRHVGCIGRPVQALQRLDEARPAARLEPLRLLPLGDRAQAIERLA